MDTASSWVELRYSGTQVLPEADGLRDELDGIVHWDVVAVRCGDDGSETVVATAAVAVLDLAHPADLLTAAGAYGGAIRHATQVLLDDRGRLRPDLGGPDVEQVLMFLTTTQADGSQEEALGLRSTRQIRARLAGPHALVVAIPADRADDPDHPAFLDRAPDAVQAAWRAQGLRHAGAGVWVVPFR